jgi:hypothetical protein
MHTPDAGRCSMFNAHYFQSERKTLPRCRRATVERAVSYSLSGIVFYHAVFLEKGTTVDGMPYQRGGSFASVMPM